MVKIHFSLDSRTNGCSSFCRMPVWMFAYLLRIESLLIFANKMSFYFLSFITLRVLADLVTQKYNDRCGMGIIQYRYFPMYQMRLSAQKHWSAHIKGETFKNGPVGRQWNWANEGGWKLQSTTKIWTTCASLLPTTRRKWPAVSFYLCLWQIHSFQYKIHFMQSKWRNMQSNASTDWK